MNDFYIPQNKEQVQIEPIQTIPIPQITQKKSRLSLMKLVFGCLFFIFLFEIFSFICGYLSFPIGKWNLGGGYSRTLFVISYLKYHNGSFGFGGYHYFQPVFGANPITFKVLDYGYASDNNYIYCGGDRMDNIDLSKFHQFKGEYFFDQKDVRRVCNIQRKKISKDSLPESFDLNTFEVLPCNLVKDKTGVYHSGIGYFEDEGEKNIYSEYSLNIEVLSRIDIIDPSTFTFVSANSNECKAKDKNANYKIVKDINFGDGGFGIDRNSKEPLPMQNKNENQFEDLGCKYTKINNEIFWESTKIVGADVNSFESLVKKTDLDCGYGYYAKDKNNIYYQYRIIKKADHETFSVMDTIWSYGYAKDINNNYSQGTTFEKGSTDDDGFQGNLTELAFQKQNSSNVLSSGNNIQINLKECRSLMNPSDSRIKYSWVLGSSRIEIEGLKGDICSFNVIGVGSRTYKCSVPIDLDKVTISYNFQKSLTTKDSFDYSFDRNKYCVVSDF